MAQQPKFTKDKIGKVLNFQTEKQKFEIIRSDGIYYEEKGYSYECICIESPSKSMVGEEYHFDARAWKDYNNNNIKLEKKKIAFS